VAYATWAFIVAATATRAYAIVIFEPPIVRACPSAKTWEGVSACLAKHGFGVHVERAVANAKLLRIDESRGTGRGDIAYVVYVPDAKAGWRLGGLYELDGKTHQVLGFVTLTVRGHTGFRIDIGQIDASSISFDGVTTTPSEVITRRAVYCHGLSYSCVDVLTACDTLVRGQAYYTFRGTATIADDGQIHNVGAREVAGSCSAPERQFLGWPNR
jgi:hypothetical protein